MGLSTALSRDTDEDGNPLYRPSERERARARARERERSKRERERERAREKARERERGCDGARVEAL